MNYEKPQLVPCGTALNAIQGHGAKGGAFTDVAPTMPVGLPNATAAAYQSDE
jgi:hypothetical protein